MPAEVVPRIPLREQLGQPGAFVVAAELVTSRGLINAERGRGLLEIARELAADPRIGVLSTPTTPAGMRCSRPTRSGPTSARVGRR